MAGEVKRNCVWHLLEVFTDIYELISSRIGLCNFLGDFKPSDRQKSSRSGHALNSAGLELSRVFIHVYPRAHCGLSNGWRGGHTRGVSYSIYLSIYLSIDLSIYRDRASRASLLVTTSCVFSSRNLSIYLGIYPTPRLAPPFRGGLVPSDLGVRTTTRARRLCVYGTI